MQKYKIVFSNKSGKTSLAAHGVPTKDAAPPPQITFASYKVIGTHAENISKEKNNFRSRGDYSMGEFMVTPVCIGSEI